MILLIEKITGGTIEYDVDPIQTIGELKNKIWRTENIPVSRQGLVYREKEMCDFEQIRYYDVSDESRIKLIVMARSGPANYLALDSPRTKEELLHRRSCDALRWNGSIDATSLEPSQRDCEQASNRKNALIDKFRVADVTHESRDFSHQLLEHERRQNDMSASFRTYYRMRDLQRSMERLNQENSKRKPHIIMNRPEDDGNLPASKSRNRRPSGSASSNQLSRNNRPGSWRTGPSSQQRDFLFVSADDTSAKESSAGETEFDDSHTDASYHSMSGVEKTNDQWQSTKATADQWRRDDRHCGLSMVDYFKSSGQSKREVSKFDQSKRDVSKFDQLKRDVPHSDQSKRDASHFDQSKRDVTKLGQSDHASANRRHFVATASSNQIGRPTHSRLAYYNKRDAIGQPHRTSIVRSSSCSDIDYDSSALFSSDIEQAATDHVESKKSDRLVALPLYHSVATATSRSSFQPAGDWSVSTNHGPTLASRSSPLDNDDDDQWEDGPASSGVVTCNELSSSLPPPPPRRCKMRRKTSSTCWHRNANAAASVAAPSKNNNATSAAVTSPTINRALSPMTSSEMTEVIRAAAVSSPSGVATSSAAMTSQRRSLRGGGLVLKTTVDARVDDDDKVPSALTPKAETPLNAMSTTGDETSSDEPDVRRGRLATTSCHAVTSQKYKASTSRSVASVSAKRPSGSFNVAAASSSSSSMTACASSPPTSAAGRAPSPPASAVRPHKYPQSSQSQQRCNSCGCRLSAATTFQCRCGKTLCARHRHSAAQSCGHDARRFAAAAAANSNR